MIGLSGCFEIVEDVTVHKDGSGTFKVIANLSQSKTQLKSIMLLDSINGYPVPKESGIDLQIRKAAEAMANTDGITGVEVETDFDAFIFTVNCNFTSIKVLNQAILAAGKLLHQGPEPVPITESFRFDGDSFERIGKYATAKVFSKLSQQDKAPFTGASYITVYRFDTEVTSCSNTAAKLSTNGKTVFLKLGIEDILQEKSQLSNSIQLSTP